MRKTSSLPNSEADSADYPFGRIIDEDDDNAGTPIIEATYSDFIQSLWQFIRVTGTTPNGLSENTTNGFQLFEAMEKYLCPVGSIKLWPSDVMPTGWLRCTGSYILRADYPDLFALIGTTYGSSLATNFALPNLMDRLPLGKGSEFPTLGATGGEINHILASNEIPSHYHNNGIADDKVTTFVYGPTSAGMPGLATRGIVDESASLSYQGKTSSVGGNFAHNNMPPYQVFHFIIKAKYGKYL